MKPRHDPFGPRNPSMLSSSKHSQSFSDPSGCLQAGLDAGAAALLTLIQHHSWETNCCSKPQDKGQAAHQEQTRN